MAINLKKENKYIKGAQFNFWQSSSNPNIIEVVYFSPETGEKKMTTVEHTDARKGEDKARTHNNMFGILSDFLKEQNKWREVE